MHATPPPGPRREALDTPPKPAGGAAREAASARLLLVGATVAAIVLLFVVLATAGAARGAPGAGAASAAAPLAPRAAAGATPAPWRAPRGGDLALPPSSFECSKADDDVHRICLFREVLLLRGELTFVVADSADPAAAAARLPAPLIFEVGNSPSNDLALPDMLRVLRRAHALAELAALAGGESEQNAKKRGKEENNDPFRGLRVAVFEDGLLQRTRTFNNWFWALNGAGNAHHRLCKYLGACSSSQVRATALLQPIVESSPGLEAVGYVGLPPHHAAAAHDLMRCFGPLLWVNHGSGREVESRPRGEAVVLRRLLVGVGEDVVQPKAALDANRCAQRVDCGVVEGGGWGGGLSFCAAALCFCRLSPTAEPPIFARRSDRSQPPHSPPTPFSPPAHSPPTTRPPASNSEVRFAQANATLALARVRFLRACARLPPAPAPRARPSVLLVNRPFDAGRSILGLDDVYDRLKRELPPDVPVRMYLPRGEGGLYEQAAAFDGAAVAVAPHGAATANFAFMPLDAVALGVFALKGRFGHDAAVGAAMPAPPYNVTVRPVDCSRRTEALANAAAALPAFAALPGDARAELLEAGDVSALTRRVKELLGISMLDWMDYRAYRPDPAELAAAVVDAVRLWEEKAAARAEAGG